MFSATKIGIEIEYLVSMADGPIESGYHCGFASRVAPVGLDILASAAREIDKGARMEFSRGTRRWVFGNGAFIIPDSFSLLETVTAPSTRLSELCNQLWRMKRGLIYGAAQHGCKISGAACPISYSFNDIKSFFGSHCNNAGMHVHINAPTVLAKKIYCNALTQIVPELIAMSANSPIYNKRDARVSSMRLSATPLARTTNLRAYSPNSGRNQVAQKRVLRYMFVTGHTRSNRTVEVRGLDTPINIEWAMALAAFLQCLVSRINRIFGSQYDEKMGNFDSRLVEENCARAIGDGILSELVRGDRTALWHHDPKHPLWSGTKPRYVTQGTYMPVRYSVANLLGCIEEEAEALNAHEFLKPLYRMIDTGLNQAELQRRWFACEGFDAYVLTLEEEMARAPGRDVH